ncbi:hypothetical protein [Thomasclavelia cocleata]|uniref:hypothetical protein n=1 Tax=Thomasclavelia cocleata TaxID=69824 RepID=UPI00242E6629|nr:hypothetical protein [Thomasclavelia cocleata]
MKKFILGMCCVLLLCGCSSKREVKNYYDVVDTFDEFGFKEEKVSLHLNGGTYYFELNGESFDMFFQYDREKNRATADRLCYYSVDEESSVEVYKNTELSSNKDFEYEDVDEKIREQLDKSLDEMDVTYEEFSGWCKDMIAKKDFSKYLKDNLTGVDYLDYVFGYDLEVKEVDNTSIMIKDKKYCILVKNDIVYAIPRTYDFISSTGYMYLPEANAGGYNQKQSNSIYNFETNEVIQGEMTQEDIKAVKEIKKWFDGVLKKHQVTVEDLTK